MLENKFLLLGSYLNHGDNDLKENGVFKDTSLIIDLINDVGFIDLPGIRKNTENRYKETGTETTLPDFEKYIGLFKKNPAFLTIDSIEYPDNGSYGPNLLSLARVIYPNVDKPQPNRNLI